MKQAVVLLLFMLCAHQSRAQAPTKHALIVAVGTYATGTGWRPTSAANDARFLQIALEPQGFVAPNVRVLADAQATKPGIVAALVALTARVQARDIVVFHFSGHGQQVPDDNHDEADGFDEALVPYDAARTYATSKNEGQHHLRDDELAKLLHNLRQKLGPHGELLVLLDACHSGTGTRGLGRARGTTEPLAPVGYVPTPQAPSEAGNPAYGLAETGAAPTLARLVCYFGSGPHELNYETIDGAGNGAGALSLAFAQALNSCASPPSYESLFDRIKAQMAATSPNQTPQQEGATGNRLFGGLVQVLPAHYKPLRWSSAQRLVLEGGTLQGLYAGTEVALYPPDTQLGQRPPLAEGRLVTSELITATVELDKELPPGPARAAWVFVTARSYGPLAVSLRLDLPAQPLKTALLAALAQRPFVRVVPAGPADLVLEANNDFTQGNYLQLTTVQDQIMYRQPIPASTDQTVASVLAVLARSAQASYLRRMQAQAPAVRMTLALIPIAGPPGSPAGVAGTGRYLAGQYCLLEVTNTSGQDAYFAVLDIQPDNDFHLLLPAPRDQPADCLVAAGQTRLLPDTIRLSPPYGTEMLKLISAAQPLDLRELVNSQGRDRSRGVASPFAQLLALSYPLAGARGTPTLISEAVNTSECVFTIVRP